MPSLRRGQAADARQACEVGMVNAPGITLSRLAVISQAPERMHTAGAPMVTRPGPPGRSADCRSSRHPRAETRRVVARLVRTGSRQAYRPHRAHGTQVSRSVLRPARTAAT